MIKTITTLTYLITFYITFLITLTANANNKDIAIYNEPIEYSQCTTTNGRPVYTSYRHVESQVAADYASAGRDKQPTTRYYIHLNYDLFHDAPEHARAWVWYHECGHHRLGHTLDFNRYAESTQSIVKAERAADCWATQEFRRHYQESELHLALQWAKRTMGTSNLRIERIKGCK